MVLNLTSRAVERDLKIDETVRRPSSCSKVRVLRGVSRRATTRTRRVADWMAGQFIGSRRSRRSCGGGRIVSFLILVCVCIGEPGWGKEDIRSCSAHG